MALSKSQIKNIRKHNIYFAIVPYGPIEHYLRANNYTSYRTGKHFDAFVLNFEEIKNIIENQPVKGYFTIYEPQFNYENPEDIGNMIENYANIFDNTHLFECVYEKEYNDNIKLNKYNW